MKKVLKLIFSLLIIAVVAFIVYAIVMAYKTSQEWTIKIMFNNEVVKEIKVENDEKIQIDDIIAQIDIEGYEAVALYDNADLSGEPIQGTLTINNDLTLYLYCEKLLNLQLVYNDKIINLYGKDGENITNPQNPTKEHARFLGWADGDMVMLSDTINYTFSADDFSNYTYTLIAKFEDALVVSFDTNGGENIENKYIYSGETLIFPNCNKEHYVFSGWQVNGQNYQSEESLIVTKNITATAIWRPEHYTLFYQYDDGRKIDSVQVSYAENINLISQPQIEGYYATGWLIGKELYSNSYFVQDIGNDGDNIIAVSTYKIENYTIHFQNINDALDDINVSYGQTIALPNVTKEGYQFKGWLYNKNIYNGELQVGDFGENGSMVNFTAQWEAQSITLSFDYGNAEILSGNIASKTIKVGDIISKDTLPLPVYKEPYSFVDWYLDDNYTNKISYGTSNNLTKDTTLYAKATQATDITAFGDGSANNPYRIYNGEQFSAFSYAGSTDCPVKSGEYVEFMDDIVMTENYSTTPNSRTVNININGNGHSLTINKAISNRYMGTLENLNIIFNSNLTVYKDTRINLFYSNYGIIKDVTFPKQTIKLNMNFSTTSYYPSLLVASNDGEISNCYNYADINVVSAESESPCFSIFVGQNNNIINNCYNYGNIETIGKVDISVFSYLNAGQITSCYTDGDIYAYSVGVIANKHSTSTAGSLRIENCEIRGNITSYSTLIMDSSSIFGELSCISSTSQAKTIYISNCKYTTTNLLLITINNGNGSSNYITDIDTIKPMLPNVDFDSITSVT